ncbi:MAG: ABC transporter ATP-binding protein [Chloroflexi bacterium]|nr:ABC transporter ATP-binding protein [Chloroflexota bacterium]
MATVELRGVRKVFGRVEALATVDVRVEDRSFTCLVGPSGSGKSTLLNIVAGLESLSEGQVFLDGTDITRQAPAERDIAMVFQSYALYPHMSVFDNMAFGLKVRKTPSDVVRQRVEEAASLLQLSDLLDRKPRQLSGGQRQRVALGRAITRHPKVFLLDEPLSNLDAQLRFQTRVELKLLFERIGGTVIYVTHDQSEAMTLADQVVVLDKGRIQQMGAPMTIYEQPSNVFVARFLGSPAMNVISGRVARSDGDGLRLVAGALTTDLPGERLPDVPAGGVDVLVGIRPELISVAPAGHLTWNARLRLVESLGAQDLLYLDDEGQSLVAAGPSGLGAALGRGDVSFDVRPEAIHLFHPESGDAIGVRHRTSAAPWTIARPMEPDPSSGTTDQEERS